MNSCDILRFEQLHAKALRLLAQPLGKLAAEDAVGEAGQVVESFRRSCLPAKGRAFNDQSVDPL